MIYADNAATTKLSQEAFEKMLPYMRDEYANPSSVYSSAQESRKAVENARTQVAKAIGASEREVYFTSGGTESDNWAIMGTCFANEKKGKHIITSSIEHHAVLHTCEFMESHGFEVTYLPVDEYGLVTVESFKAALRDDTVLATIMHANNEIGTVQNIAELSRLARENNTLFHTDAVQTTGHLPVNVDELGVDLLSMSGHKFHGPKGIGALYVRKGTKIARFHLGGGQERNMRAGTENVAGIVGMGAALESAVKNLPHNTERLLSMRDYIIKRISESISDCRLNGHPEKRLPNNVNFSFEYIEGESLLLMLNMNEIAASSGSACTSGSLDPSHVLLAIGLSHQTAHGSLRLTFSHCNTMEEMDYIVEKLVPIVARLREMSPLKAGSV